MIYLHGDHLGSVSVASTGGGTLASKQEYKPFGEVRSRLGGGLAGHNGLKSLKRGLGGADFWRVRVGVGRPDSTDPDIVASYVLSRFREPREEVAALIGEAAEETDRLVERIASPADA